MEQLGFDGMPRRLYPCTPTRLSTWLDCPRRYRMTYLDRPAPPKGPPWAHNSLGASVHNALAAWWRLPPARPHRRRRGRPADQRLDHRGLRQRRAVGAVPAARAATMVEGYVAGLDPAASRSAWSGRWPPRTEQIARVRPHRPAGRPAGGDGPDELVVVDYKTGRHLLTVDDARSSLAAGPVRAGRAAGAAPAVPPGRAAPPAHRPGAGLGAHPRSRSPGSWGGPRTSRGVRGRRRGVPGGGAGGRGVRGPPTGPQCGVVRLPRPLPRGHARRRRVPAALGRPGRRARVTPVPSTPRAATSGLVPRRGRRARRRSALPSVAFQNVVSAPAGGLRRLDRRGVRGGGDAGALGPEPLGHPVLGRQATRRRRSRRR